MKLKSIVTSQYKKKFDYHKGKRLSFEDKKKKKTLTMKTKTKRNRNK